MTVLRIEPDDDGVSDLYLPEGAQTFAVLGEPDATLQGLRDAFEVAIGDWFLDQLVGVERELLVGKLTSLIPPEVETRRVLARVAGVTQVLSVRVRRVTSRADAESLGADALARWDEAPNRILYVEGRVTTATAGTLDLGFALALPST